MALLIGGQFTVLNTPTFDSLCKWNGSALSPCCDSILNPPYWTNFCNVVTMTRTSGGILYVGLNNPSVGGGMYKWNGTAWSTISDVQGIASAAINTSTNTIYYCTIVGQIFSVTSGGTLTQIGQVDNTMDPLVVAVDSSGNVYVGGYFTAIAPGDAWPDPFGDPAIGIAITNNIAKWNGSAWSVITSGSGPTAPVTSLLASGTTIYSGENNGTLRQWNGSTWTLKTTGIGGGSPIKAMVLNGSDIYLTCWIMGGVYKWNGTSTTVVGTNPIYGIKSLAIYGGYLYAGYDDDTTGYIPSGATNFNPGNTTLTGLGYGLVKINLSSGDWIPLSSDDPSGIAGRVTCLLPSGGDLYIGGTFSHTFTGAGITGAKSMARYDGTTLSKAFGVWNTSSEQSGYVFKMQQAQGSLYIFNSYALVSFYDTVYDEAGTSPTSVSAVSSINKWDGSSWSSLAVPNSGGSLTDFLVTSSGDIYVSGNFSTLDGVSVTGGIARWNGSTWLPLGTGLTSGIYTGFAYAMAWTGSTLFVIGSFTHAGGTAVNHIAAWNGTSWSALGTGLNNYQDAAYRPVLTYDSATSMLYAGGRFTTAGGVTVNRIAKWNGTSWSALGSGTVGVGNGTVNAIYVGASNKVYVGGAFDSVGGTTRHCVAIWDSGTNVWSDWGSATTFEERRTRGPLYTIKESGGNIYVGFQGIALDQNTPKPESLYKWNGTSWLSCGGSYGVGPWDSVFQLLDEVVDTTAPTPGNSGTITTSEVSATSVTLNWTAATDNVDAPSALQYRAYYSTDSNLTSVADIKLHGTPVGSYE
jgi:hypothetical protein